jgi:hypothetical protein
MKPTDDLETCVQVLVTGTNITFEKDKDCFTGWVATGWQQGLPVARKPVTEEKVREVIAKYPLTAFRY